MDNSKQPFWLIPVFIGFAILFQFLVVLRNKKYAFLILEQFSTLLERASASHSLFYGRVSISGFYKGKKIKCEWRSGDDSPPHIEVEASLNSGKHYSRMKDLFVRKEVIKGYYWVGPKIEYTEQLPVWRNFNSFPATKAELILSQLVQACEQVETLP